MSKLLKIVTVFLAIFTFKFNSYTASINTDINTNTGEQDTGLDNFDSQAGDSGNWYEKRVILKKAGPKRTKISNKVAQLKVLSKKFLDQREQQKKILQDFLIDIDIQTQDLDKQIAEISQEIEQLNQKNEFDNNDKNSFEIFSKNKTELVQLKTDLDLISQLDKAQDGAIEKLNEQLEVSANYEQQALHLYDLIADVLDDQKAKNYYFQMVTLLDNVEAIERYINTQFSAYMDNSLNSMQEQMTKVKSEIKELHDQGIILSQKLIEEQKSQQEKLALEKTGKKKQSEKSWTGFISDFFMQMITWIVWPFKKLYSLFF